MSAKNPTVITNWPAHGKIIAWGQHDNPSLADMIAVVEREFPGKKLSEIVINNHVLVSEGPMYARRNNVVKFRR